jgi:hypothetical protein
MGGGTSRRTVALKLGMFLVVEGAWVAWGGLRPALACAQASEAVLGYDIHVYNGTVDPIHGNRARIYVNDIPEPNTAILRSIYVLPLNNPNNMVEAGWDYGPYFEDLNPVSFMAWEKDGVYGDKYSDSGNKQYVAKGTDPKYRLQDADANANWSAYLNGDFYASSGTQGFTKGFPVTSSVRTGMDTDTSSVSGSIQPIQLGILRESITRSTTCIPTTRGTIVLLVGYLFFSGRREVT